MLTGLPAMIEKWERELDGWKILHFQSGWFAERDKKLPPFNRIGPCPTLLDVLRAAVEKEKTKTTEG